MSFVNHLTKEVNFKIVYYGPGLSGKTTNIQYIYEHTHPEQRGHLEIATLSTENERTLFFDFLPLSVGEVQSHKTRIQVYSLPGQTLYDISRQFVLKGVDGIVFVFDSQNKRMEDNVESFQSLEKSLDKQGYDINKLPLVFQYNKRDLSDVASIGELQATFNSTGLPYLEAVASRGDGVMETLQLISQLVIRNFRGD